MNTIDQIKEKLKSLHGNAGNSLNKLRQDAFQDFATKGIPTSRHEEWKYTRIAAPLNKTFSFLSLTSGLTQDDLKKRHLPGHEEANALFFVNGLYDASLSTIRSANVVVLPLEEAASNQYANIISSYLGHSRKYLNDGINAMNTASLEGGVFVFVAKEQQAEHPIYIYNISDAREENIFSQPRSLFYIDENAHLKIVETYMTLGTSGSFTNQVMEVVTKQDARLEYYKIQNDAVQANSVSTTHIIQAERGFAHAVTISLNGGMVRNNLNFIMAADNGESHMYGLYFQDGQSHIDNHTIVDNIRPGCLSNQLYKGILSGASSGVFNGKIFVQQAAQKINAYQSNKNILLSDTATVNTKPQLEIFADDVKCSHGCTVGRLDEEGMFYLQSRGIPQQKARALLVHAFAMDILEHIHIDVIRNYVDKLISKRLEKDF